MTSAKGDKESIFASFRQQADLYFIKPFTLERVVDDLRAHGLIDTAG